MSPDDPNRSSKERILRVAAECFAKTGYERTRMVAVARAAEISRAGLYSYFPGKAELLLALNEYVISEWRSWTRTCVRESSSPTEIIARWLRAGLADEWRVTAVRVLTSEDATGDLLTDRGATRRALSETRRLLATVLLRGIEQGEFRSDLDVESTAHALQAVLLGIQRNHASDRPIVSLVHGDQVDALVDLIMRGLR